MENVKPSTRRSITFRMTLAVCAFVILFQSLMASLTLVYFRNEFKRSISAQQLTLLTVASQDIDHNLRSAQKSLLELSRSITPEIVNNPEAAQRFLDSNPDSGSTFDNALFLFSKEGRIIAESPYLPNRRGRDISFRDYYKKTMKTGQPVISEPFISTHTPDTPSVMFTAPVLDGEGRIIAILGGGLNLLRDNILGELSRTRIAKTGYFYLFTRDRTMIMHPDKARIMKLAVRPGINKLLDRALDGFEGTGENVNSQGLNALTSFKHLKTTDWILGANYPLDEAYEPIERGQKYFFAAVIASMLLIVLVTRIIMERYTRTLVRFAAHVRDIASKHGEKRLFKHDSRDEIGVLVSTFNAMVQDEDRKSAELFYSSTHDSLTDLYNRTYFDSELKRYSRGRQSPVSIVVADIDLLKRCNDSAGHAAGDAMIKSAAQILLESFRVEDVCARIGGDEFGVLLPGVSADQAELLMQRLRTRLGDLAEPVENFPLSMSLGCATAESPAGVEEAFKQADDRMYLEKRVRQGTTE